MRVRISLGWMIAISVIIFAVVAINTRLDHTKAWGRPVPVCNMPCGKD